MAKDKSVWQKIIDVLTDTCCYAQRTKNEIQNKAESHYEEKKSYDSPLEKRLEYRVQEIDDCNGTHALIGGDQDF